MAELLGVARTSYVKWEEETEPKATIVKKIAEIFRISIDELTGNTTVNERIEDYASDHEKYIRTLEETSKTLRDAILLSLNAIQASQADLRKYAMENDNRTLEILRGVANLERHLGTGIHEAAAEGMRSVLNEPEAGRMGTGKGVGIRGKGGKSS